MKLSELREGTKFRIPFTRQAGRLIRLTQSSASVRFEDAEGKELPVTQISLGTEVDPVRFVA